MLWSLLAALVVSLPALPAALSHNFHGIALSPYRSANDTAICRSRDELSDAVATIAAAGFQSIQLEYLGHECSPAAIESVYGLAEEHNVTVQPTLFLTAALADNRTDYDLQRRALLDSVARHPNTTDVFLFGGEAINRRIDTEANLRGAFDSLIEELAQAGYQGNSTINEPVDASLAVATCDLDFLGISLDPWYEYDPPAPSDVVRWSSERIKALQTLCPSTPIQVTRFGWTSNATTWGPIEPSVASMGEAFAAVNAALAGGGTLDASGRWIAWEYDDQLWKFATDFLAAAKVGTYVERYYGLFGKAGFDWARQVGEAG
ncbi:unnamed protein product [Parajaminaea phylloscopi]